MYKLLAAFLVIMMVSSVMAQSEVKAPKKKSSLIQFDKDLTKIFGKKKEKKPKKEKKKKEKKQKESEKKPAPTPRSVTPSPKPEVKITPSSDSLEVNTMPKFYKKRTSPVLNIGLVYYGEYYTDEDFAKVQELLEHRFEQATNGILKLNVIFRAILPFEHQIQNYPDYKKEAVIQREPELITEPITDMDKLQRIWYYDNKNMSVVNEIYKNAKSHNLYGKDFSKIDALAVVTGAQFEGLGFASGRVAVTENPMEIAWGLSSGRTEFLSDAKVVDELIHELGHTLYLGHAADQCFDEGISYEQTQACCAASENKNDVLSYCRQRNLVDENLFYGFEACNLKTIKEKVIPAMLSGGEWALKDVAKCE
jgi:hypothetical protein